MFEIEGEGNQHAVALKVCTAFLEGRGTLSRDEKVVGMLEDIHPESR